MPLIRGGRAARGTRTADPGGLGDDAYMAAVLMAAACYFVLVRRAAAAAARHGFDGAPLLMPLVGVVVARSRWVSRPGCGRRRRKG
jgi:hypothetical protein